MPYDADLVVIGSGPAGEKGAVQAAYFGKRVVLVERGEDVGGTAVHTGTVPSKSFHETARRMNQRDRIDLDPIWELVDRKDAVRLGEALQVRENLEMHGVEILRGSARVLDGHTVAVDGPDARTLTAEFILVATGSRAVHPAEIDFNQPGIDDAETITRRTSVPKRLTVLGAGVIGAEYASIFAEIGSRVTIVDPRAALLPWLDPEITERLGCAFEELGMTLELGRRWSAVEHRDEGIVTRLDDGREVLSDCVLFASGRVGATEGMGLQAAGVVVDDRHYIRVDEAFATAVPSILAAGDVVGAPALASVSMDQGRVAVCRAFGFAYKQQVSDLVPTGIYTIPEVSAVGMTEPMARAAGVAVVPGWSSYTRSARGHILHDTRGGVRLIFDGATRKLIGAHHIGENAAELVHIGQAMIAHGATVDSIVDTVFGYPTLAECYKYAAYDALGQMG
jgi:NAD(P) transhydrogenase